MDNPDKVIELAPHEWRSERPKPREPIFGPMAKPVIFLFVLGLVVSYCAGWAYDAIGLDAMVRAGVAQLLH